MIHAHERVGDGVRPKGLTPARGRRRDRIGEALDPSNHSSNNFCLGPTPRKNFEMKDLSRMCAGVSCFT